MSLSLSLFHTQTRGVIDGCADENDDGTDGDRCVPESHSGLSEGELIFDRGKLTSNRHCQGEYSSRPRGFLSFRRLLRPLRRRTTTTTTDEAAATAASAPVGRGRGRLGRRRR